MKTIIAIASSLFALASAQNKGAQAENFLPDLTYQKCTGKRDCTDEKGKVVIDANWHWNHIVGDYTPNCFTGNEWNSTLCDTVEDCTKNCAVDGITEKQYSDTYGIQAGGGQLNLSLVTVGQYGTNVGSRTYLMDSDSTYKQFQLLNQEFTFDVDVSKLPCGTNGALYFVEMAADGGMGKYSTNKCGAAYGTGYCDAQCPHDLKWINGESNSKDWKPSKDDPNAGIGHYGTCCAEMDIWEANSECTQITPHSCSVTGQTRCEGVDCGDNSSGDRYNGVCDKDGCDFNPYRLGTKDFYGAGMTVDTSKPFTVITQFITSDGTDTGELSEIKRYYWQDGNFIENADTNLDGLGKYNSVTQANCDAQKALFGETDSFGAHGGLKNMGESLGRGMTLVLSLWDDHEAHMLWLDSTYPPDSTDLGALRGPCATTSGDPVDVEKNHPDSKVVFMNIRYGDIGSTVV